MIPARYGQLRSTSGDVSAVVGGDEHAAGALEDVAEALAGEPDRRRVDERLHLVDVVADDAEEQRLVAVVQRGQRDVLVEVVGQPPQVLEEARDLLLLREHDVGQQPAQAQRVAFLLREGSALVESRIVQQVAGPVAGRTAGVFVDSIMQSLRMSDRRGSPL